MKNWPQTVISQYTNSTKLLALLESIDEWIQQDTNFENFYNFIWNVDTATGYGLDVWGRIVGVDRVLKIDVSTYFGFGEADDRTGFNQASFWDGKLITENYRLNDEQYRFLIFAKAAFNITNCSIPAINKILMDLFPNRGNTYVTDGRNGLRGDWFGFGEAGDRTGFNQGTFMDFVPVNPENMSMIYVFDFVLQSFEIAIVTNSGVLPKPVGVKATAQYIS